MKAKMKEFKEVPKLSPGQQEAKDKHFSIALLRPNAYAVEAYVVKYEIVTKAGGNIIHLYVRDDRPPHHEMLTEKETDDIIRHVYKQFAQVATVVLICPTKNVAYQVKPPFNLAKYEFPEFQEKQDSAFERLSAAYKENEQLMTEF